jgi:hypothetical protein
MITGVVLLLDICNSRSTVEAGQIVGLCGMNGIGIVEIEVDLLYSSP